MFLPCSPCCGCGVDDGKPRTDPKDEGTWVPTGDWITGVTWSFVPNPGNESGTTWFFYGSVSTSKPGGSASSAEQQDWGNLCNWYSHKSTTPSSVASLSTYLTKRATRLPPETATVHIYGAVVSNGLRTVKNMYVWGENSFNVGSLVDSTITCTGSAHGTTFGTVTILSNLGTAFGTNRPTTLNGGLLAVNGIAFQGSTVNGGAKFLFQEAVNRATVNGGGEFGIAGSFNYTDNYGTVNGGCVFRGRARNRTLISPSLTGTINGGAVFNDYTINDGNVYDGAVFNYGSKNGDGAIAPYGVTYGGAEFFGFSENGGVVNGGATFSGTSFNSGTVNGGAEFNDDSINSVSGTVNDGATFNDNSCSQRFVGDYYATPCTKKFVAHPTDLPTCNTTKGTGCDDPPISCGCE